MATAVPSRFAVLAMDDDGCRPKRIPKPTTASVKQPSSKNVKNDKPMKTQQAKKDDKKKPKNKKKNNSENQQWEQWKEKDSVNIEETYENELHQALLLSKLAYESHVENGIKDPESSKKSAGSKKKKATMSLEEFNNLGTPPALAEDTKEKESDAEYFQRLDKEAKKEIIKSKEKDMLKLRLNTLDDDITMSQLKVEVEKRDQEIQQLHSEVQTLKNELSQVKERNKKLYQILALGEMKDKASVLAEVAKLQEIRDELTSEVSSLHAQLEQERSKTRLVTTADVKTSKQSNKKRPPSENA